MRNINKIIIHCSATKRSQNVNAAIIRSWHKSKTPPWSDIGYHFVILKGGKIEVGRPLEKMGAHCKGFNSGSIGICLEGGISEEGKPEDNFDEDQFNSLRLLCDGFKWQFKLNEIKGHRDYSPDKNKDGIITKDEWLKVCPCFDVEEWYNGTRKNKVKAGKSEVEEQKKNGVGELHSTMGDNSTDNMENSKSSRKRRHKRSGDNSTDD